MDIEALQRRHDEVAAQFRTACAARDWGETDRMLAQLFPLERELAAARGEEHAVPIEFRVRWDQTDPRPRLFQSPEQTLLLFRLDPGVDGSERSARVDFHGCAIACFGGNYVDVRDDHPLQGKGLEGNAALRIVNSRWLAELSRRELSQPRCYPYPWQDFQHLMFTFSDALVECIAESFLVAIHEHPLDDLASEIASKFAR